MKKLLFIAFAALLLGSCSTKQTVKKDRMYYYGITDTFGDIQPDMEDLKSVMVHTYNEKGYMTISTGYDEDGEIIGQTFMSYKGYDKSEDVKITEKTLNYDGTTDVSEVYYDEEKGKWINTINGRMTNEGNIQTANIELLTDDVINTYAKSFKKKFDISYKGEYTRYDKNGNWTEGYYILNIENGKYTEEVYIKREILEVW